MRKLLLLPLAVLIIPAISFAASMTSMSKDEVTQTFADKTLETIPLSTVENKLVVDRVIIHFGKDGNATGRLTKKTGNDPQNDEGTWTVNDDGQLCITWKHWSDAKPFCDYVYDAKNSVIFISPEGEFVSLALKKDIQSGEMSSTKV